MDLPKQQLCFLDSSYKGTTLLFGTVTMKFIILVQNVARLRKRKGFFTSAYIHVLIREKKKKKGNYMQIAFYLNIYLFQFLSNESLFLMKNYNQELKTNILSTCQQDFLFFLEGIGSYSLCLSVLQIPCSFWVLFAKIIKKEKSRFLLFPFFFFKQFASMISKPAYYGEDLHMHIMIIMQPS